MQTAQHGLLVVQLVGMITASALLEVKAQIARDHGQAEISAFVVDFGRAIIAMDGAGLDRVLEGHRHGTMPVLPAAMIVAPEVYNLFDGHCLRMAAHGVVRQAFTDGAPALLWATRHALRKRTEIAAAPRADRPADRRTPPAFPVGGAAT